MALDYYTEIFLNKGEENLQFCSQESAAQVLHSQKKNVMIGQN